MSRWGDTLAAFFYCLGPPVSYQAVLFLRPSDSHLVRDRVKTEAQPPLQSSPRAGNCRRYTATAAAIQFKFPCQQWPFPSREKERSPCFATANVDADAARACTEPYAAAVFGCRWHGQTQQQATLHCRQSCSWQWTHPWRQSPNQPHDARQPTCKERRVDQVAYTDYRKYRSTS